MRAALYLRVSTDSQTVENQERELRATALRLGHDIVAIYRDDGISGARGRDRRPGFDALHRDIARRKFDLVMAWSVCRLGRSLRDLLSLLEDMRAKNVDLYLEKQGLDTSTPSGRLMFQMVGAFSEFEREMIRERVVAGMKRARADGKHVGRPKMDPAKREAIIRALGKPNRPGVRAIARQFRVSPTTIQGISRESRSAEPLGAPRSA
jgi:DNA invertase Pin-like site-specific DNA recombinase